MLSHPLIVGLGPPLPWLDVEHKPYELIISIITSSSELRPRMRNESHAEAHLYLLLCWFLSLDYLVAADQAASSKKEEFRLQAYTRLLENLLTHHIISSSFSGRDESFVCIKLN